MTSKKLMKVCAMLLCLVMAIGLFAGCSGDKSTPSGDTKANASTASAGGDKKDDGNSTSNFNSSGYPIVKDKITIKVMLPKSPTQGEPKDLEHFKAMEELTNIHMEFMPVDSTSWEEKKNLALASGDLPDLFFTGLTVKDESMYGEQGKLIIPLNKLIDQYAPNLKKMMVEYPSTRPAITAMDGNIYSLPYLADTLTVAHSTLYVRGDYIKQVGTKKATTVDEFYTMLTAFKGLGADKIPIVADTWDTFKLYMINAFGDSVDILYGRDKNDKVIFVPATEQYKRMLEFLNKLYTEKLLDQEVFTQKREQAIAKISEGKAACMTWGTLLKPEHFASGKVETELLQPLTSQWNSKQHIQARYPVSTSQASITKVNKYPEATMRWLDINYSDDDVAPGLNSLSLWLGIRGKHWDYTNADKSKYARLMPKDSKISEVEWSTRYVSYGWGPCKLVAMFMPDNNPGQEMKATQTLKNWLPFVEEGLPNQYFRHTPDEQNRLNTLATDIETYMKTMEANFITGKEPISNWDKYVDQLKKMGLEDLLKLKETAYARYKQNK